MKITKVSASDSVVIPIDPVPYPTEGTAMSIRQESRCGKISPKFSDSVREYVLVRIDTDEGIYGIGEAPVSGGFFGDTAEHAQIVIDDYFGALLVGQDPFDREQIMNMLNCRSNSCAISGIDLALHDLVGKALGVSVSTLIGDRCRERVAVALEIASGPADAMAKHCVYFMEQGVRAFKAKIGGDPEADIDRVRAIREAVGPDVLLRTDADQSFSVKDAIRFCRLAERYDVNLEMIEQPVPLWDLKGMADIRRSVDTMVAADESCFDPHSAMQVILHEAADILCVKMTKDGGLYAAKKIASMAQVAGLRCVVGASFGLGIERAAKLHLTSSSTSIEPTAEFTETGLHHSLLQPSYSAALELPLEDGCMAVPSGPGLGIEVDEERMERWRRGQ